MQQEEPETGRRQKYVSAHDLRRGCAQRLINAGVSAETLKVVMRHHDFATTEKFYGATRAAQSAAAEVYERLIADAEKSDLAKTSENGPSLSAEEVQKLRLCWQDFRTSVRKTWPEADSFRVCCLHRLEKLDSRDIKSGLRGQHVLVGLPL